MEPLGKLPGLTVDTLELDTVLSVSTRRAPVYFNTVLI